MVGYILLDFIFHISSQLTGVHQHVRCTSAGAELTKYLGSQWPATACWSQIIVPVCG